MKMRRVHEGDRGAASRVLPPDLSWICASSLGFLSCSLLFFFNILYMLQTTLPGLVCSSASSEKAEFYADVVTVNYPQSQSPLDLNPFPGGPPDG